MSVAEISAYGMTSVAHANLCIQIITVQSLNPVCRLLLLQACDVYLDTDLIKYV